MKTKIAFSFTCVSMQSFVRLVRVDYNKTRARNNPAHKNPVQIR